MTKRSDQHLKIIGVDDNWETPPDLFKEACKKYDIEPFFDAAATKENTKCYFFCTPELDSLRQCWFCLNRNRDRLQDAVFCNPPYTKAAEFVAKAYHEHICHNATVMMLIFSKTDTKWWHQFIEGKAEVYNHKGRIKFYKNGEESKNPAPYPSCWVIWRAKK